MARPASQIQGRSGVRSGRPTAADWFPNADEKQSEGSESKEEADRRRREEWDEVESEDEGFWEEMEPQAPPGFSKGVHLRPDPREKGAAQGSHLRPGVGAEETTEPSAA